MSADPVLIKTAGLACRAAIEHVDLVKYERERLASLGANVDEWADAFADPSMSFGLHQTFRDELPEGNIELFCQLYSHCVRETAKAMRVPLIGAPA